MTYFGLYTVGQAVGISCSGQNPEWLDSNGDLIAFGSSTSAVLTINPVTDAHHGVVYTCRFNYVNGTELRNYTVIAVGKSRRVPSSETTKLFVIM